MVLRALKWGWLLMALPLVGHTTTQQPHSVISSQGVALEVRGLQSHFSGMRDIEEWRVENRFNEVGAALRYEWRNDWFIQGAASRGSHLRYIREIGEDEDGNPEFEERHGRSYTAAASLGKRFWVNPYFSITPQAGILQRGLRTPDALIADEVGTRRIDNHYTLGLGAEYRVIGQLGVSLNFIMLSSGERQQGIGFAYYFN